MNRDLKNLSVLAVILHGRRIGVINRLGGDSNVFSFEEDYIDDRARATLSLSFKSRSGSLLTEIRPTSSRLPPFFSNLLPEGRLREYLAERSGVKPDREFFLLAALGADLPGAVVVAPYEPNAAMSAPAESVAQEARPPEPMLRFSLAGVQLKFSAMLEASGGLTIPANGIGGSWIVKLPSAQYPDVPENEYLMMRLAGAVGIDVPSVKLITPDQVSGLPREAGALQGRVLAVERFDRASGGSRIHMEDFAQVYGIYPDGKYEGRSYSNIASVLWAETGEEGTYEFIRRLVFNVMIGNGDAHLKNWTLLFPDTRAPVIAPAYDLVSTVPYIPDDRLALTFGGSRGLHEITRDQLRRFADKAGLPMKPLNDLVADTATRIRDAWNDLPEKEILRAEIRETIDAQISGVAVRL